MIKTINRGLCILLALAMVLGFIPVLNNEVKAVTLNQQNIADRADFFFNTTWVCQKDVNAWRDEFTFKKGETYHLPYGQPVNSGAFIGYGVELEEFLMAAADGDSVFYARQSEFNGWTSVYYATDCAAFVAMCWGTVRQDCSTLPYFSTYKGKPTENNIYNILQLGDALDSTSVGHVVLVSDLIHDDRGKLIQIEITEQTPPQLKRTYFTPSELAAKYGEEFGIYRYEGSVPAVPEWGYTTECTNYAAYGMIDTTDTAPMMSLPCSSSIDSESVQIGSVQEGQSYTVTRLYENTANELWYRIVLENDKIGYIAADYTIYREMLLDDIFLTDAVFPNAHIKGKTFNLEGSIYSKYNQLVTASGYIYQGFGTNSSPTTGATDYVTGNSYTLKNSQIDYQTSFGDLSTGNHTMAISVNYRNYFVQNGTIVENTGELDLAQEYFMVVSTSTNQSTCDHSYTRTVLSEGSCTQPALSVFACSSCGSVYKQSSIANGHSFGDWNITAATCTKDGEETRTCLLCGETERNILSATGHQYDEEIIPGSCLECPRTVYTCSYCGNSYTVYPEDIMYPWTETLPNDVDPTIVETKTQYRYSDLAVLTSDRAELEGHLYLGEIWEIANTETLDYVKQWPAGFDRTSSIYAQYNKEPVTESEEATTKVSIDSDSVTGYLYYHWCYNNSYFSQAAQSGQYTIFHAYYSTTKPDSYRVDTSDMSYCTAHECCSNTDWFFVAEVNTQTISIYRKMYLQGQWQDYSQWDDAPVQASDTRQVETRTVYRYPNLSISGHVYDITETPPTCTEAGVKVYLCNRCGDTYREDVPALGHHYEEFTVEATCTQDGQIATTCTLCNDTQLVILPAIGHQYESIETAPSCTEPGVTIYTCSHCGDQYTTVGATSLGHNYHRTVVDVTCTTDGTITDCCDRCGDIQTQIITAPGHQYDAQITEPTCTEPGYTTFSCFCGDSYTAEETAPTGHNYQTTIVDPTCTSDGSVSAVCLECGNASVGIIPATGHQYKDGICSTCGEAEAVPVTKPTLTLKSPTLEFKDMICIVAFYTAENTEDVVEMGMITYKNKVAQCDIETADYVIPGATYVESAKRYYSNSQGIHAKYLADTLYLACYAKLRDGSYVYTKLAPYSPITYAQGQLKNSTDTKLKQLVVSMLNYGAEAQLYFGHNTANLANATLTADQLALPDAYHENMVQAVPTVSLDKQGIFANNMGFSARKPAISFEGAFCINYFFTPNYLPNNGITLYYWNSDDYNTTDVLTTDNATGSILMVGEGIEQYRADIKNISAKKLSQAVYVAAVYSDGSNTWTSGVLGYSIGAYCSSQVSSGSDIAALSKATAVYGYHAKQYFG